MRLTMLAIKQFVTAQARANARRRMAALAEAVEGTTLLDIGAAEGWAGEYAADTLGMTVQLVDVVDLNRTRLPHQIYDGHRLPFADHAFDTVTLMLTLHHCTDPIAVLREAARVARKRIIITESVYRHRAGRALLTLLDGGYNGLRSHGRMLPALHFKTVPEWKACFAAEGFQLVDEWETFRWLHRQHGFVTQRNSPPRFSFLGNGVD